MQLLGSEALLTLSLYSSQRCNAYQRFAFSSHFPPPLTSQHFFSIFRCFAITFGGLTAATTDGAVSEHYLGSANMLIEVATAPA